MRPRKKPKEVLQILKPTIDDSSNDYEAFLQAFEKPTQIYRYLHSRNLVSPLFLSRNLTYMKKRMSRNSKRREEFSVDDLLKKLGKKNNYESSIKEKSLSLDFKGFFLKDEMYTAESVEIEACILKLNHKKKSSAFTKITLGKVEVDYNPETVKSGVAVIQANNENFIQTNGNVGKSYVLQLWARPINRKLMNGYSDHSASESPPNKRPRLSQRELDCAFSAELVIYNKQNKCVLKRGEYDVSVKPALGSPSRSQSFESVRDIKMAGPFETFRVSPTIKFSLSWSGEVSPVSSDHEMENIEFKEKENAVQEFKKQINGSIRTTRAPKSRVFYQFIYNNTTRQQTESRSDFSCPWCMLNCMELYALLKHLRLSHSRFSFTYSPHPKGARIDVTINQSNDGSYDGNPQDTLSNVGFSFCRLGPVHRTPVTCLLVYRPKRGPPSMSEFLEVDEPECLRNRTLQDGHNRLYYHTESNQPVHPREIIIDSEGENDPDWLQQKTIALIDEFTDVNEGEKEIMKMWNLHTMHDNYIGDCQLPLACAAFVEKYGKTILEKNLEKNFLLHMVSLYDFSLIKPDVVFRTMSALQALREKLDDEGLLFHDAKDGS